MIDFKDHRFEKISFLPVSVVVPGVPIFKKAVRQRGLPDKVTINKSGTNTAALEALIEKIGQAIEIRQIKYLNNLIEIAANWAIVGVCAPGCRARSVGESPAVS